MNGGHRLIFAVDLPPVRRKQLMNLADEIVDKLKDFETGKPRDMTDFMSVLIAVAGNLFGYTTAGLITLEHDVDMAEAVAASFLRNVHAAREAAGLPGHS